MSLVEVSIVSLLSAGCILLFMGGFSANFALSVHFQAVVCIFVKPVHVCVVDHYELCFY